MIESQRPRTLAGIDACVDATLAKVGKTIVLGLPVGIGKPNTLVNAFVQRALADASIHLTIFTALSLRTPQAHSDLERRFLEPFVQRVFGDYPELMYTQLLTRDALPANIVVNEFFLEPGAWLRNGPLQQNYISSNYTHVARDLIARKVNVIAQLVARPETSSNINTLSLSCNPDLTVDLLPHIRAQRSTDQPVVFIGQVHDQLPFMYGDAAIAASEFDFLLDDRNLDFPLFSPPNMPIGITEHAIALHVSSLVKDGGTLQLGIGELGDAIVYALKLRHERSQEFAPLLDALGNPSQTAVSAQLGGTQAFERGLYGCTEMLVDGYIDLYRAGILKRRVYAHAVLQALLDKGRIGISVNEDTLLALHEAGLSCLTSDHFSALQFAGVFKDNLRFDHCHIIDQAGVRYATDLQDIATRSALAANCLGEQLRNGVIAHGGFFFGPKAFYATLRDMPDRERGAFAMQRISFINELYGDEQQLKVAQRRHARFINTALMVTGLGAAVSDGLASGQVVSGVGGQYNFVAMAHALPEARSILCVRSTRTANGRVTSNIIWNYAHVTIPRHLRDIVVTEYGIADLRGRTDSEVVMALVNVMDARFQDQFVAEAKSNYKLSRDYVIPERARRNTPQRIAAALNPYRERGMFDALPFGSDFTEEELLIARALRRLQSDMASWRGRLRTIAKAFTSRADDNKIQSCLQRLALEKPATFNQYLERRLVSVALLQTLAEHSA